MHSYHDIFDLVSLNNISNRPKSGFFIKCTAACMVLGPDLGWGSLKNSSKIIFSIKIMKNPDYGVLEMLFSDTRSNIS